nr:hypothetical protein Iba_scaffold2300CG1010 [Ipomoea batatas]
MLHSGQTCLWFESFCTAVARLIMILPTTVELYFRLWFSSLIYLDITSFCLIDLIQDDCQRM